MLKSILLPIGDTTHSERAIQQTAMLAKAFSARVSLLGLVETNVRQSYHQFADPVSWRAATNQKQAALADLAAKLEMQGVTSDFNMLGTLTFDTFIRYAHEGDFDLLIFSEADRTSWDLMRNVLAYSSIPVFIVRSHGTDQYRRILLPLDGSQRAECMVPLATALAQIMESTLLLAHIIKEPEMPRRTSPNSEDIQLAEQLIDRNRQEIERYLTDLSTRLPVPSEIHVQTHHSVTTALHDLIKHQDIDLVGLCAHGFSGKPEWPFGGITSNLIDYCPTSLMVLQDLPSTLPAIDTEISSNRYSGGQ